jgi:predicted negative regulator of RcsB-dependent stress response
MALLVAACSSPDERLAGHMRRGEAYLEQGQTQEALLEFQNARRSSTSSRPIASTIPESVRR